MAKYKYIGKLKGEDGEVEAFKWTGYMTQIEDPEWIVEAIKEGRVVVGIDNDNKVATMTIWFGVWVRADIGDYIVKYETGKIVPYKSIYFEKRYKQCDEKIKMESYRGSKVVEVEPLSREEFYKFGNSEGYEEAKTAGYKVVYEDGYISWCPKEVFEKSYIKTKYGLPFGRVLEKEVRGFKWTGDINQLEDIGWMLKAIEEGKVVGRYDENNETLVIEINLGVWIRANVGDYIIKYETGEIVPYQSTYFEKLYSEKSEEKRTLEYKIKYEDGRVIWCPKQYFEKSYVEIVE